MMAIMLPNLITHLDIPEREQCGLVQSRVEVEHSPLGIQQDERLFRLQKKGVR
jgi:hypothetical protein